MDESSQQRSGSQEYSADPRLAHQKVLQPSESFIEEVNASQHLISNQSQPIPQGTAQAPLPNSQPVQPAQPELTYNEPRPATDGQIPVGMSASQMGFNQSQHDTNRRTFLKPFLIAVIVLMVLGAGFLTFRYLNGYGTRTVQGDGFTYTVTYNRAATEVSVNGKSYLQGRDQSGQAMRLAVGKADQSTFDCHTVAGGTISVIATPEIEGKQHNLCYSQSLNLYEVNFTHNGVWYYLVIAPKYKSQTLNHDTVKMIASSVRISS